MEQKKVITLERSIERLIVILVVLVLLDFSLLFFLRTQVKTIGLLKEQRLQLEQDQRIINSAEEIYQQYKDDIEAISEVFPGEEDVLAFLQQLETLAKQLSDDSVVKFASLSPQEEGDQLFLLFTINLKTDMQRLTTLMRELEVLPYMTRVLAVSVNFPDKISGKIDASLKLKLYVQNPFSTN